jgi:hypothetical protein
MGRHEIVRDEPDLEFGARLRSLRRQRGLPHAVRPHGPTDTRRPSILALATA